MVDTEEFENVKSADDFLSSLEDAVINSNPEGLSEFDPTMDYDKFIALSKTDLARFCRIVEPLTKASTDEYGKCVLIKSISTDVVRIQYYNKPYIVVQDIVNKSGKLIKTFAVSVDTVKKLTAQAYASLVFVESEGDINISICQSLMYVETKPLSESNYEFDKKEHSGVLDRERAIFLFKKVANVLSTSERAADKAFIVKDGKVLCSAGSFVGKLETPFAKEDEMLVYPVTAATTSTIVETAKGNVSYGYSGSTLVVADGVVYAELPVGDKTKAEEFYIPLTSQVMNFEPTVVIVNDSILRLFSIVKSLDYLSKIVTMEFKKSEILLTINTENHKRNSVYTFSIVEGEPETTGVVTMAVETIQSFFALVGADIKYSFTEMGLGVKNGYGTFLMRKL